MSDVLVTFTQEEAWLVYDLLTARGQALAAVEEVAMQGYDSAAFLAPARKLRILILAAASSGDDGVAA